MMRAPWACLDSAGSQPRPATAGHPGQLSVPGLSPRTLRLWSAPPGAHMARARGRGPWPGQVGHHYSLGWAGAGLDTHPITKTRPAAAASPTGKVHSTTSSVAMGATEKPKNPSSEQMAASAMVCPRSWDTWAVSVGDSCQATHSPALVPPGPLSPGPPQRQGLEGLMSPLLGSVPRHPGPPVQRGLGSRGLTRAKATQTTEARQKPTLTASVKRFVRSTYRPSTSAPRTPNTMNRAPQRPANSCRRGQGAGSSGAVPQGPRRRCWRYSVTRERTAQSRALSLRQDHSAPLAVCRGRGGLHPLELPLLCHQLREINNC